MEKKEKPPVCLTIAGLDPSGGAGVVADIKTFSAFGCFATAAVTSVTFQNTLGVFGAVHQRAESVRSQVQPVIDDLEPAAVKTGMLPTREIIDVVAELTQANRVKYFVVDPVVRSTSGFDLIDDEALVSLVENLFPLSIIVTPNLPETERIVGRTVRTEAEIRRAGDTIRSLGAKNVLIKGGHGETSIARDYLFTEHGVETFDAPFIDTTSTHGTGCILSAAITSNLALGHSVVESVRIAKSFVHHAIKSSPGLGKGHSPINI